MKTGLKELEKGETEKYRSLFSLLREQVVASFLHPKQTDRQTDSGTTLVRNSSAGLLHPQAASVEF